MLTPEQSVNLIRLVKEQPLLYANFNFNAEVDQQIEVLKLETWENISKTIDMETPQVIEEWNLIEEQFNCELQRCKKAPDFRNNCQHFAELQFLIRHYQQKNMFPSDIFEGVEYEFVITEDDLKSKLQEDHNIFHELDPENKDEENKDITAFFESFNESEKVHAKEDSSWIHSHEANKNIEDTSDEEFGRFLVQQLKTIACEDEKRQIKRDILKML